MLSYIVRRVFLLGFTLLGLSVLIFCISRVAPGDPARLAAGPQATEEMVEQMRQEFGLDKSLPLQYWAYLEGILQGDFGRSIRTRHPVSEDLRRFFPATLELVLFSLGTATLLGILLGTLSGVYHDRWLDQIVRLFSISGLGLPAFWLALMLQLLLATRLRLLPIGGRLSFGITPPLSITHLYFVDSLLTGHWTAFTNAISHLVLPALSLSFPALASIIRITRADVLEVLEKEFITTARAKGLTERIVIWHHMLRNALIPTTTMVGLRFGWMLGGTILVETVFDWPGIGLYGVQSAIYSDFAPIMGVTLLIGFCVCIANLLVDLLYGVLDPRIRYV